MPAFDDAVWCSIHIRSLGGSGRPDGRSVLRCSWTLSRADEPPERKELVVVVTNEDWDELSEAVNEAASDYVVQAGGWQQPPLSLA